MNPFGVAAAVIASAVMAVVAWAGLGERNRFTLREYVLPILPPGHAPIRMLHLSDLHMAPWQRRKQNWIRSLGDLKPDLVVCTGDMLGHRRGFDGVAHALEPFRGIPGMFVNGSNDYFGPQLKNPFRYLLGPSRMAEQPILLDTATLMKWFAALGWIDLNNRAARLTVNGTVLGGVGVDDPHLGRDEPQVAAAARAEIGDVDVLLGVTHAPYRRVLDAFTELDSALLLAGHTHGGQVCLPERWGGTLVTNCDIPRSQARGMSVWRHGSRAAALHVSAGIGTSIFAPVRLFCPPEASLITLIPSA